MKHALIVLFLSTSLSIIANAQKLSVAGYLGLSIVNVNKASAFYTFDNHLSAPDIGVIINYKIDRISLRTGLLLSRNEVTSKLMINDSISAYNNVHFTNLRVPLNIQYNIPIKKNSLVIFGGPYLGYSVSGKNTTYLRDKLASDDIIDVSKTKIDIGNKSGFMKPFEVGANIGVAYEMYSTLSFNIQYGKSFQEIKSFNGPSFNYQYVQFGIGVKFYKSKSTQPVLRDISGTHTKV